MEAITIDEFKPIFMQQQYKHIGLFADAQGMQRLVPYNSSTIKPDKRLEEITVRMKGAAVADGLYYILAKNSVKKDVIPSVYPIKKGDVSNSSPVNVYHVGNPAPGDNHKMFTYEEALEMKVENERYKLENEKLAEENAQLSENVDNLMEQIDLESENVQTMGDGQPPQWLNSIMDNVVPLSDAYFLDRKEERDLEAKKLNLAAQRLLLTNPTNPNINKYANPDRPAQSFPELWEDMTEDQQQGLDEQTRNRLFMDWLNRFAVADPEGYEKYIKENELA